MAVATCEENSTALARVAKDKIVEKIQSIREKFYAGAKLQSKQTIANANLAREIGLLLQTLCGHGNMPKGFWTTNALENRLGFDIDTACAFMAVSRKYENKIKTISEAACLSQMNLALAGEIEIPKREQQQIARNINPVIVFLNYYTILREKWANAIADKPMEDWDLDALHRFDTDTEWLEEYREKAKRLLDEKNANEKL